MKCYHMLSILTVLMMSQLSKIVSWRYKVLLKEKKIVLQ